MTEDRRSTTRDRFRSGPSRLDTVLANLWIYPGLVLLTAASMILFWPFFALLRLTTRLDSGRITRLFIWLYGRAWVALVSPFAGLEREGFSERGDPPCILVMNHASFFDIYCLGALPFADCTMTVKAWPFRMWWYRPFMRLARYIDTETLDGAEVLERSRTVLDGGGAILFFPEGSRSRDGRLGRFYSGAFKVAVETGAKVVPLCLSGTREMLPPGRLSIHPSRLRLRALEPLDPADFEGETAHIAMRKEAKRRMAEALAGMESAHGEER